MTERPTRHLLRRTLAAGALSLAAPLGLLVHGAAPASAQGTEPAATGETEVTRGDVVSWFVLSLAFGTAVGGIQWARGNGMLSLDRLRGRSTDTEG